MTGKTLTPAKNPVSVAKYITAQIDLSGKKQYEIAEEVGFTTANIITMIKQGKTRLPLSKVGKFAKAIGVDRKYLFSKCMAEYSPDAWEVLEEVMNGQPLLTDNELEFIDVIRQAKVENPKMNDDQKAEFLEFVNRLRGDNKALAIE